MLHNFNQYLITLSLKLALNLSFLLLPDCQTSTRKRKTETRSVATWQWKTFRIVEPNRPFQQHTAARRQRKYWRERFLHADAVVRRDTRSQIAGGNVVQNSLRGIYTSTAAETPVYLLTFDKQKWTLNKFYIFVAAVRILMADKFGIQVCLKELKTTWLYLQWYLLLTQFRFVQLLTSLFPSNLEVYFTSPPIWPAQYRHRVILTVDDNQSYICT